MKFGENVQPMGRYYCLNISLIGSKLQIFIIECENYLDAPGIYVVRCNNLTIEIESIDANNIIIIMRFFKANRMEYPHEDIRQEAVKAVSHFCAAYYIELDQGVGNLELFNQSITKLIPTLTKMVVEDEAVDVVCACLDMIAELLKTCKQGITNIPGM